MTSLTAWPRRVRRAVLARRRLLAALCAGLAVLVAVRANAAPPPPRTTVLTAAHDLAAGAVVVPGDLQRTALEPDTVPSGALRDQSVAVGRTTAAPVRAGEPLTDVRLVTASLLRGYPGLVAVPVRVGDPVATRLLRVGDRIDLVAADPQGDTRATVVAREVPVLALPRAGDDSPGIVNGAPVVLGVSPDEVGTVASSAVSSYLSVVIVR